MTTFFYKAINENGKKINGIVEAQQIKQARELLRQKKLIILNIHKTIKKNYVVKGNELVVMSRQLANLLLGGLSIEKGFQILTEQTEKSQFKQVLLTIQSKLLEGLSLSVALREVHFPILYYLTIAAGEKTGRLDQVLVKLANYLDGQWQTRKKLRQALIYPGLMMFVSLGVVIFLLQYVIPKMIDVYNNFHQSLPYLTRCLIYLSNHLQFFLFSALSFCLITIYGICYSLKKSKSFKEKIHRLLITIPLLGHMVVNVNTARFLRTVGLLSQSGIPILEAMQCSVELILLLPIQKSMFSAIQQIGEGASIHLALKQTGYISAISLNLISGGEASGQLDTMMDYAANMIEADINQFHATFFTLLEPFVTLFMGAVVLMIVLAVLLPVFQLDLNVM